MGNLNKPDPCVGPPIANLPRSFGRSTSNIPERPQDDCFEPGPPTLFLCDWDYHINGDPISQNINSLTQCSLMEWTGSEWVEISDFNPVSILPVTNTQVINISRFGDDIWLGCNGYFVRSIDGGQNFRMVSVANAAPFADVWIDKSSDGSFWVAQESVGGGTVIQTSIDDGESWEVIANLPEGAYLTDGRPWGPGHVISCHPTNPDVVIVTFTDQDEEGFGRRQVFVTQNGGNSWSAIILPGQFNNNSETSDDAAEAFFATGDQGFNANGVFFTAYEIERYNDVAPEGPENMHFFYVARSSDYATFTAVNVTPYQVSHFGFQQQLYIYGDILFHAWAQEFDGGEVDIPSGFDNGGLITFLSRSDNGGQSWTLLTDWRQPTNELIEMPGYIQDIFYDPDANILWAFFEFFDDNGTALTFSNLSLVKDFLQWKVSGSSKVSVTDEFRAITGIPDPRSKYASVTRPWPPI